MPNRLHIAGLGGNMHVPVRWYLHWNCADHFVATYLHAIRVLQLLQLLQLLQRFHQSVVSLHVHARHFRMFLRSVVLLYQEELLYPLVQWVDDSRSCLMLIWMLLLH